MSKPPDKSRWEALPCDLSTFEEELPTLRHHRDAAHYRRDENGEYWIVPLCPPKPAQPTLKN